MRHLLLLLVTVVLCVNAIPIPNGVEGEPEIECGPNAITINFNTQAAFGGHVYVKGLFASPECKTDGENRAVGGIRLPFDTCGVSRTRSLNPRGVFVSVTVVITFHPQFITKVDGAYNVQCFYMEADKTVDTNLDVSLLTTAGLQTQNVPMPVCRYEIKRDGPDGDLVTFALVGDKVYHKWTCDTETSDVFCMWVYGCFVDDRNGDRVALLDDDGCALDKYVLNNLEYPTDLMAGVPAHVFKYADRSDLYFNCQIKIVIKEPNTPCPRPECQALRKKRETPFDNVGIVDVTTQMSTLDIDEKLSGAAYKNQTPVSKNTVCMQTPTIVIFVSVSLCLVLMVVTISTCLFLNNGSRK